MLTVVDGKLMNTREVGNAVAKLLLEGVPIDQICKIDGMPTPSQIAYMRRHDSAFNEAMTTAFEGGGIESALVLMEGARTGNIGKNQLEAAKWVAERMAPDLFQERKTITNEERSLTDDELMYMLQAAARTDERVKSLLVSHGDLITGESAGRAEAVKQLRKIVSRRRVAGKSNHSNDKRPIKDVTPKKEK